MEGESELDSSSRPKTFSEFADELCSHYMSIGVSCDEYWNGDPTNLKHYAKAHEVKERTTQLGNVVARDYISTMQSV